MSEEQFSDNYGDGSMNDQVQLDDFNVDEEYRPEPMLKPGSYYGNVIEVKIEKASIAWKIAVEGEGLLTDGETPVNGFHIYNRNWMPVKGDESKFTAGGRNKRQTKINMMKRFADGMKIHFGSMEEIEEAIQNQEWVGIYCLLKVEIRKNPMTGELQNEVKSMTRVEQKAEMPTSEPTRVSNTGNEIPRGRGRRRMAEVQDSDDIPF